VTGEKIGERSAGTAKGANGDGRTRGCVVSDNRGGMLQDAAPADAPLHAVDVRAFLGAQRVADVAEQGDVVEYWKSAPYLFNFMDNYALKRAFQDAPEKDKMVRLVREFPETFLDRESARAYQPLEPANARLRELLSEMVERGMWRLLWIAPSLGHYALDGPFAVPELANVTKRLVFSYEAERCMMRASHPRPSDAR
jgi:muconolactone delta-isomerase